METHNQQSGEPITEASFNERRCRLHEGGKDHDSVTSGSPPGRSIVTDIHYIGSLCGDRPYTLRLRPTLAVSIKVAHANICALHVSHERRREDDLDFFGSKEMALVNAALVGISYT